jgi:hypothetical protein
MNCFRGPFSVYKKDLFVSNSISSRSHTTQIFPSSPSQQHSAKIHQSPDNLLKLSTFVYDWVNIMSDKRGVVLGGDASSRATRKMRNVKQPVLYAEPSTKSSEFVHFGCLLSHLVTYIATVHFHWVWKGSIDGYPLSLSRRAPQLP